MLLLITGVVVACSSQNNGSANGAESGRSGYCPASITNALTNPGFERGTAGWNWRSRDEVGSFTVSIPAFECTFAGRIYFSDRSDFALLYQSGFRLQRMRDYTLSFAAYSNSGHDFAVTLENSDGSSNHGVNEVPDLTNNWQTFTIPFSTGINVFDPQLRFVFDGSAMADDVYWIDDVSIIAANQLDNCPEVPENVLINPGFEGGETGWSLVTADDVGTYTASRPAYECDHAARLEFSDSTGGMFFRQNDFALQPDTDYILYFSAYSTTGDDFAVMLEKRDRSANYGIDTVTDLTADWQTFSYPFTTGSKVSDPQLRFAFAGRAKVGDVYWIDDVIIIPAKK